MEFNQILIAFTDRKFRNCFLGKNGLEVVEIELGKIKLRAAPNNITVYCRADNVKEKAIKSYRGQSFLDAFVTLLPEIEKAFKRV